MQLTKNNMRWLASATVIGIIFIALLFFITFRKSPERSPRPVQPAKEESEWYIQFSVKNQKSTAYTEMSGAQVSASGKPYFIGSIAVHPRYPVNSGGNPLEPLIPFGTQIYLDKPIKIQGQDFTTLKVIDTGDVNYRLWPGHPYWVDIYHGTGSYYNIKDANDYGVPLVNYTWYEKWR